MSIDEFNKACDYLYNEIDPEGFESRRWEKDEGVKLRQVANFIQKIFGQCDDFEASISEQTTKYACMFDISLGSNPLARITAKLGHSAIAVWAVEVDRGIGTVPSNMNVPGAIPLDNITEETVSHALASALNRIRP